MSFAIGFGLGLASFTSIVSAAAVALAGPYLNVVSGSFADNSLVIRDTVTPANSYDGPLITNGAFNKFTYSRASTATFVGANGLIQTALTNIPRIHYDPVTLACLGYLHEGARTNLHIQSQDLNALGNTLSGATAVTGAATAPDGTLTASKLVEDGAIGIHRFYQARNVGASTINTYSVYLKAAERTWAMIDLYDGATESKTWINLATGAVGTNAAGSTTVVESFASGWYRVKISRTYVTGTGSDSEVYTSTGDGVSSFQGDITKGIYVWGMQLELGGAASSYIPTTTVAVTRAADLLSLPNTQFNLTQAAGTLYVKNTYDGGTAVLINNRIALSVNDGTANERLMLYNSGGLSGFFVADGNVAQANDNDLAVADGVFSKSALAYAVNNFAFVQDGRTAKTDGAGTPPTTTALDVGNQAGALALNGTIQEFAFIGQRVSNAAMQALTT